MSQVTFGFFLALFGIASLVAGFWAGPVIGLVPAVIAMLGGQFTTFIGIKLINA